MNCRYLLRWLTAASLICVGNAQAIYLDSIIFEMPADKPFLSKKIYNDSHRHNIYNISAVAIDKPGPGGESRRPISQGEVLFTPLSFSLAPNTSEFFKIFYRGPNDNRERYYRIQFSETPVTLFPLKQQGRWSQSIQTVVMDTILVVRPRKVAFDYQFDENKGVLRNTGNTFFRLIIHKGCQSTDDEATMLHLLPGETYRSTELTHRNKKFIVAQKKYTPLGTGCFN